MLADNKESCTPPPPQTLSPKLTDLGPVEVLGLCWRPLGPGIGDGSEDSLFSGGAGELTQLAVIGLTTERSSRGDLGLGVSDLL